MLSLHSHQLRPLASAGLPAAAAALGRVSARQVHVGHPFQKRNVTVGRDGGHFNTVFMFVPQAEEWQIERFGKFCKTASPGLNIALPLIDRIAYKRSLKETLIPISPQTAITRDNVHVRLGGGVYCRVVDSYAASYGVESPETMISILAQSAMRKCVGSLDLDQLFLERERLNQEIASALDVATKREVKKGSDEGSKLAIGRNWGIEVFRYEISDISVDKNIQASMERQSNAERLRRAEVLESEGHRQKKINESEGEKISAINESEGEKASLLNRAEGEAGSLERMAEAEKMKIGLLAEAEKMRIELVAEARASEVLKMAEATAKGIEMVSETLEKAGESGSKAVQQRLAEQYLKEYPKLIQNSRLVVVPDRPNDVSGVVATAMGVWGEAGKGAAADTASKA